jgi:hypothetical protein
MIALAANKLFMRLKAANNTFETYDLMITLVAYKLFRRIKILKSIILTFDLLIVPTSGTNIIETFDLLKKTLSIS